MKRNKWRWSLTRCLYGSYVTSVVVDGVVTGIVCDYLKHSVARKRFGMVLA